MLSKEREGKKGRRVRVMIEKVTVLEREDGLKQLRTESSYCGAVISLSIHDFRTVTASPPDR